MSVATPEAIYERLQAQPRAERYGMSLSCLRAAGKVALDGASNMEQSGAVAQLRGEFDSCVFEGLSSDQEHGENLQVTKFDSRAVIDGQVMSGDGETPIAELVENGCLASREASEEDFRMLTQAKRDGNDLHNALEVDAMVGGRRGYNTRMVISSDPKEAIGRDGAEYWYEKGYIKDQIYIQMYHWTGAELVTGSLSCKTKDLSKLKQILGIHGVDVPEDIVADDLINYAITFTAEDAQGAMDEAFDLRRLCDDSANVPKTDTVDIFDRQESMDKAFNEMYLPVAVSLAAGSKTPRVAEMASAFMGNSQYLSPEVRAQLLRIENKTGFDDDDARLMHQLSVYAAIERLRVELSGGKSPHDVVGSTDPGLESRGFTDKEQAINDFIVQMGRYIEEGTSAGRMYSSCGAAIKLLEEGNKPSPQDAFGGVDPGEDKLGSRAFTCRKGHTNIRPLNKTIDKCGTCHMSVKC